MAVNRLMHGSKVIWFVARKRYSHRGEDHSVGSIYGSVATGRRA